MFVADRGRGLRIGLVVGGMTACLALLAACSGGGGSGPRTLPPLSTTPAAETSTAPPTSKAADLAAVTAVVRRYYQMLNAPTTVANADALAALMTKDCECRKVSQSTREIAERGQHYFGATRLVAIRAELDSAVVAEALVQYDVDASGIATRAGREVMHYGGVHAAKVNFILRRSATGWLISGLVYIKVHD